MTVVPPDNLETRAPGNPHLQAYYTHSWHGLTIACALAIHRMITPSSIQRTRSLVRTLGSLVLPFFFSLIRHVQHVHDVHDFGIEPLGADACLQLHHAAWVGGDHQVGGRRRHSLHLVA